MFNFDEINPEAFSAEFAEYEQFLSELRQMAEQEAQPVDPEAVRIWQTFGFTEAEGIEFERDIERYMSEEEIMSALNSGR